MNPKYVTSLELSKKLKESGVKQESEWYWVCVVEDGKEEKWELKQNKPGVIWPYYYSAFHVGELGEMLPFGTTTHLCEDGTYTTHAVNQERIVSGNTEAEARGKMVLYLKENKLI